MRWSMYLVMTFAALCAFSWNEPETIRVEGEIVDMSCFTSRGARGEAHRECAARCLNSGQPAGIVIGDGELLTIVGSGKAFSEYAAKTVKLEGKRNYHTITAKKMWVWENESWQAVALKYGAPESESSKIH